MAKNTGRGSRAARLLLGRGAWRAPLVPPPVPVDEPMRPLAAPVPATSAPADASDVPPRPCTCGARPGQGHVLLCSRWDA